MKIGINGFGRIGRLVFRALWERSSHRSAAAGGYELVHVNDPGGDAHTAAHLLAFDSVHGRWQQAVQSHPESPLKGQGFVVGTTPVSYSQEVDPTAVPWRQAGVEMVLECSGRFKTPETLQPYFDQVGLKHVVVACPVKGDVTNTQVVVDAFKSDLRRARSCGQSLIPTTTGSAKAIGLIFPELQGRLNGHAVRVPLLNASLTDAVFELKRDVTAQEVNAAFEAAANGPLGGILGYETRPLVSVDYVNDPRSAIVDGLSTMVVNGSQLKVYAWYDNEWGYSSRMADLVSHVALLDAR